MLYFVGIFLKTVKVEIGMNQKNEPIAIIGMGCKFPGNGNNPDQFWNSILERKDSITEIPKDRWNINRYYDPNSKKEVKPKLNGEA